VTKKENNQTTHKFFQSLFALIVRHRFPTFFEAGTVS